VLKTAWVTFGITKSTILLLKASKKVVSLTILEVLRFLRIYTPAEVPLPVLQQFGIISFLSRYGPQVATSLYLARFFYRMLRGKETLFIPIIPTKKFEEILKNFLSQPSNIVLILSNISVVSALIVVSGLCVYEISKSKVYKSSLHQLPNLPQFKEPLHALDEPKKPLNVGKLSSKKKGAL